MKNLVWVCYQFSGNHHTILINKHQWNSDSIIWKYGTCKNYWQIFIKIKITLH